MQKRDKMTKCMTESVHKAVTIEAKHVRKRRKYMKKERREDREKKGG